MLLTHGYSSSGAGNDALKSALYYLSKSSRRRIRLLQQRLCETGNVTLTTLPNASQRRPPAIDGPQSMSEKHMLTIRSRPLLAERY